ncbi:MAG: sulfotransferase [Bacteroidota bacterium]
MNNLFIVGVGRSGTSLLQSMMDSHSQVTFLPETQFVRSFLRNSDSKTLQSKEEIQKIIRQGTIGERIPEAKLDMIFASMEEKTSFKTFYNCLLGMNEDVAKLEYYGDKDPRLLDYIEVIAKNFPSARILHIYRDPRDIVLSKTKADWSKSRSFWVHAMIGQAQISNGRKKGKQYFGDNFIELKYEELIDHPEEILKMICNKLGLEFEKQMLDYQRSSKRLVSTDELQWKKETLKPLMRNNVEKWRNGFSGIKIWVIENLTPEWFDQLNYKRSNTGLSSWMFRPLVALLNTLYTFRL